MVNVLVNSQGKVYTINGQAIVENNVDPILSFKLSTTNGFNKLIVNNVEYTSSSFSDNELNLSYAEGTNISWTCYVTSYSFEATPSSGNLSLTNDTLISIKIRQVEPT